MNPIGIQYLYWNTDDLSKAIAWTAEAGAEVFECGTAMVLKMSSSQRKALAREVRERGLSLTLNGGIPGADLCAKDPELREQSVNISRKAIQAIADVGSPVWGGVIYSKWLDIPEKPFETQDKDEMWARGVESLQKVLPVAETHGVDVCFEVVNRFEAYMITTAAEGVRFCQDINSPRAKLLLDKFNMNIEEDSTAAAMLLAMKNGRFGHLHICESNRGLPGLVQTDTDWTVLLSVLREIDYSGIVTMEPMVLRSSPNAAKYRIWRDMVPDREPSTLLHCASASVAHIRKAMGR